MYNIWLLNLINVADMTIATRPAFAFQGVRPAKVNFYLRSMKNMGFPPEEVLGGTNINEKTLEDSRTLIQIPDYIRIVSNMMELSQDATLAFRLGDYLEAGDLGVLGCAVSASRNFREGIEIWQRYNHLFFGDLISIRQFSNARMQYFEFIPRVPLLPYLLQFFVEEKIGVEKALVGKLYDVAPQPQSFSVTYPRPKHGRLYDELLELEVEFEAKQNIYSFDNFDPNYDKHFQRANKEVYALCIENMKRVANFVEAHETLSPRVRKVFMESLPDIPSLASLAEEFNMSDRTFSRKLEMEQSSYKALLASVREELAKNLLLTTTMSAEKIAQQLGFKETSGLCKAFKQWTGGTTKQFRENNRVASI